MSSSFAGGLLESEGLVVGVTVASELCRRAQTAHRLGATSAIALGRLLIATILAARIGKRNGSWSLQVVAKGRVRQIFSDINTAGDVRGFIRPPDLAMPVLSDTEKNGRREIAHAIGDGILSQIRIPENEGFSQSSTALVSGEIDLDVEHFLATSDQIPSALVAEVLLNEADEIRAAGGILAQALPGGNLERLNAIRAEIRDLRLHALLGQRDLDARGVLASLFPSAVVTEPAVRVRWKCRCSHERVLAALTMLNPADLAEMAQKHEQIEVDCDFCATHYAVSPEEIDEIFNKVVRARGKGKDN